MEKRLFTSESVTDGHPDKICDQLSDAVLDACLAEDPQSRVACECCVTTGLALVMGEVTTNAVLDIPALVRSVICDIGYDDAAYGFDGKTCSVLVALGKQSSDIAMGVDRSLEAKAGETTDFATGAGDQGMMFGYACNETPEYMPLPIYLAHALTRKLSSVRKSGALPFLRPDGKAQVSVEYEGNTPVRVDTVVVSTQHDPDVTQEAIRDAVIAETVIRPVIPETLMDANTRILRQPNGPLRHRRAARRFRPHGPQDYCGHIWRLCAARRRRVLRQRSHQGGPQRGLCGAAYRKEHRGSRACRTL